MIYLEPIQPVVNLKNDVKESKIVVLYGPSGAGKTLWKDFLDGELMVAQVVNIIKTYPRNILKDVGSEIFRLTDIFTRHFNLFNKVITMTTRPPRDYEKNLVHYRFLTEAEFAKERELGNVLEETENFGFHYGSNKQDIENALKDRNAVIVLDNKGVKKLKEMYGDRIIAIYMQIDAGEMKVRMLTRGESHENIAKRLASIQDQNHQEAGLSDYVLNSLNRIDIVMRDLMDIVLKECLMRKDIKHIVQPKTAHLSIHTLSEDIYNRQAN
jgi:guanylate kinase